MSEVYVVMYSELEDYESPDNRQIIKVCKEKVVAEATAYNFLESVQKANGATESHPIWQSTESPCGDYCDDVVYYAGMNDPMSKYISLSVQVVETYLI